MSRYELFDVFNCGRVTQEYLISSQLMDREFNHIYLLESDRQLNEYHFQKSEISGLFFVRMNEFKRLLVEREGSIKAEGILHEDAEDRLTPVTRDLTIDDFVPQSDEYYQLLFDKIHSLTE